MAGFSLDFCCFRLVLEMKLKALHPMNLRSQSSRALGGRLGGLGFQVQDGSRLQGFFFVVLFLPVQVRMLHRLNLVAGLRQPQTISPASLLLLR